MGYRPVTPFRRPISAALRQRPDFAEAAFPSEGVDKWETLRALATARRSYGLTDRQLSVLQALLSFHPRRSLNPREGSLVVYPSNRTICERLNGMPCSTMRRHLARLVAANLILRRDSPNGKRYSRRHDGEKVAFGFDLAPLVARFQEFRETAQAALDAEERLSRQRETVRLMFRDLTAFIEHGRALSPHLPVWQALTKVSVEAAQVLRRKLGSDEFALLETRLDSALSEARASLEPPDLGTSHNQSEHHNQSPKQESEFTHAPVAERHHTPSDRSFRRVRTSQAAILDQVLSACPTIAEFAREPLRHWPDLVRTADTLAPMLGVSQSVWDEARLSMGPANAATVISVLMERSGSIHAPGAYLRTLSRQARGGRFSPEPLLRHLQKASSQLRTTAGESSQL